MVNKEYRSEADCWKELAKVKTKMDYLMDELFRFWKKELKGGETNDKTKRSL